MPLNAKSIAVSVAVLAFFGIAIVGAGSGLATLTCCKRALIAAVVSYLVVVIAVKAINTVVINAMINNQVKEQQEQTDDG